MPKALLIAKGIVRATFFRISGRSGNSDSRSPQHAQGQEQLKRRRPNKQQQVTMDSRRHGATRTTIMNLALIGLMIAQSVCSFDGLNLRRRPFQEPQQRGTNTLENKNGEETNVDSSLFIDVLRPPFGESQRSALGNDEIPYAIDMAPARSFTDPQRMTSKVTGSISSSQPVVVSCEFQNNWTAANQPTDYPIDNAHWSPIVIASHSDLYQMWSYAAVASSGVQEVAETGGTSTLTQELDTETRTVLDYNVGSTLWLSDSQSQTIEVVVASDTPLISAISMIAPSPDFFSGFYDQNVLDTTTNTWYESFIIETYPWDAGTKTGQTYNANGVAEDPAKPITFLSDPGVPGSAASLFLNPEGTSVDPVATWTCTTSEFTSPVTTPVEAPSIADAPSIAEDSPTVMTPNVFFYDYLDLNPVLSPSALTPNAFAPAQQQTAQPSEQPIQETLESTGTPTDNPTLLPTELPTSKPTEQPTFDPTGRPTESPTDTPTLLSTAAPTFLQTVSSMLGLIPPTFEPTPKETTEPSSAPVVVTSDPMTVSARPAVLETQEPSTVPVSITYAPTSFSMDYSETPVPETTEPTAIETIEPSSAPVAVTSEPTSISAGPAVANTDTPEPTSVPLTITYAPTSFSMDNLETPVPETDQPTSRDTPKPSSSPVTVTSDPTSGSEGPAIANTDTPEPTSAPLTITYAPTSFSMDYSETPVPETTEPTSSDTPEPSSSPVTVTSNPTGGLSMGSPEETTEPTIEPPATSAPSEAEKISLPTTRTNTLSPTLMPSAIGITKDFPYAAASPILPLSPEGYLPPSSDVESPVQSPVHSQMKDFELLGWVGRGQGSFSTTMSRDGSTVAIAYKADPESSDHTVCISIFRYGSDGIWSRVGNDILGDLHGDEEGVGKSVALSHDGNTLAVGFFSAPCGRGIVQATCGRVSVYFFNGSDWGNRGGDIFSEHPNDLSGYSLSMSDDGIRLAIGSPTNGGSLGQVRLYEFDPIDEWRQLGADIKGNGEYDYFGSSVELSADGTTLACGAVEAMPGEVGYVKVFRYNEDSASLVQLGDDLAKELNNHVVFSLSLSLDGNILAVGAIPQKSTRDVSGVVRIYQYEADTWGRAVPDVVGGIARDNFGYSVSLDPDGTTLVVGAPETHSVMGSTTVYLLGAGSWSLLGERLRSSEPMSSNDYGRSVTMSTSGLIFAVGGRSGAYVYEYPTDSSPGGLASPTSGPTILEDTASPTISPTEVPTATFTWPDEFREETFQPSPTPEPTQIETFKPTETEVPYSSPTSAPTDETTRGPVQQENSETPSGSAQQQNPGFDQDTTLAPTPTVVPLTSSPSSSPVAMTPAPLDPTSIPIDEPSMAPADPTIAPVDSTSAPIDPTPAPVEPTTAPVYPTAQPVDSTPAPVYPTSVPTTSSNSIPAPETTPAPVESTTAPVDPTLAPVEPTEAPVDPTTAPADPTLAPVEPTAAPVDPTIAPVDPTPSPVDPTTSPVDPTSAPVDPTQAPIDTTSAPVDPTPAPMETSSSPTDEPTLAPIMTASPTVSLGGETAMPFSGDETAMPFSGGETAMPFSGGETAMPFSGGETAMPFSGGETSVPNAPYSDSAFAYGETPQPVGEPSVPGRAPSYYAGSGETQAPYGGYSGYGNGGPDNSPSSGYYFASPVLSPIYFSYSDPYSETASPQAGESSAPV